MSQPAATIHEPRLLTDYTYRNRRTHAGAVTRRQCRVSRTPAGLSQAMSCLLTTVVSRSHTLNMCTHKNFKIRGTQHQLEYYPSYSHKESICLGSLAGTVQILTKAALKFTGSWGSWGSEVPKSALTPHLPDELDPLLDSLTPLISSPKVGTYG